MERNPPLSRRVDLHGLDMQLSFERARQAIADLPPGGGLEIFTNDPALEDPLRQLCLGKSFEFVDGSEPATLCFLIYRPF